MITLDPRARYTLAGEPGEWRYVGQATYLDDDGREVEHDHVRMAQVRDGLVVEAWVDPGEVTGITAGRTSGVFTLEPGATIGG